MDSPKLIYVVGQGRTGSTLLGSKLQRMGHGCMVCEMFWWLTHEHPRTDEGVRCACGQRVHQCEFWQDLNIETYIMTAKHFANRNIITFFFPYLKRYREDAVKVKQLVDKLIEKFNSPIIETSKSPVIARFLKHIYGDDVMIIRTRRPAHKIIKSWSKPKGPIPKRNGIIVFLEVIWYNFLMFYMKRNGEIEMEFKVNEILALEELSLPRYTEKNTHLISGNPSR